MRVIVELFGRAWMLNFQTGKMADDCEESSQEFEEPPPMDPHSVHGGQFERRGDFGFGFGLGDSHGRQE